MDKGLINIQNEITALYNKMDTAKEHYASRNNLALNEKYHAFSDFR